MRLLELFEVSKLPLLEHNIINIDDNYALFDWSLNEWLISEGNLESLDNHCPEGYQWFMTVARKFFTNDDMCARRLYRLPAGSSHLPDWAKKAIASGTAYEFYPDHQRSDEVEHISHFLLTINRDLSIMPGMPGVMQQRRRNAERFFKTIMHVSYPDMVRKSQEYFNKKSTDKFEQEDFKVVLSFNDHWKWVELASQTAFEKAGRILQNCIGSIYTYHSCQSRNEKIFILLDPKNKGHAAARLEGVNDSKLVGYLAEIKGKQNTVPDDEYKNYCVEFIKKFADGGDINELSKFGFVVYKDTLMLRSELTGLIKENLEYTNKKIKTPYSFYKLGPQDLLDVLYKSHHHTQSKYVVKDLENHIKFGLMTDGEDFINRITTWETTPENLAILNDIIKVKKFKIGSALEAVGLYQDHKNPSRWPDAMLWIIDEDNHAWQLVGDQLENIKTGQRVPVSVVGILADKGALTYKWDADRLILTLTKHGKELVDIHSTYPTNIKQREEMYKRKINGTDEIKAIPDILAGRDK